MKLSTVIIAKNEEEYLEQCLKSIASVSDEIVFVDTGSTDRTKEIASHYTKSIYDFEWIDDFSAARNFGKEKSTGDVILSIDGDEAVSEKDWPKIYEVKKIFPANIVWGLSLPVRNYVKDVLDYDFFFCESEYPAMEPPCAGYVQHYKTLIFPNRKEIFFENIVHESVEESLLRNNGKIEKVDIPVHHYGYLKKSLSDKQSGYEKLLIKELEKDKENLKKNYDYAHFLFIHKRNRQALPYMEKAYDLSGRVKGRIAYFLAIVYYSLNDLSSAKGLFEGLMGLKQPGVTYYLALIADKEGFKDKALQYVRKGLRSFKENVFLLKLAVDIYKREKKEKLAAEYTTRLQMIYKKQTGEKDK